MGAYKRKDEAFNEKLAKRLDKKQDVKRSKNTYYRIWKYLVDNGLDKNKADYVRIMVRELVFESAAHAARKFYDQGIVDGIARKAEENVRRKLK